MKTQQIKKGLIFISTRTGLKYEVTRVSEVSVWYKFLDRDNEWRNSKTVFLDKFNYGFKVIEN